LSFALIFSRKMLLFAAMLISAWTKIPAVENHLSDSPNSSTQKESNSSNWAVSADFLAWYASEEVAAIWADVITIGNNTSSWKVEDFDFKWDYGFRIGTGYGFAYDQWDTAFYWTWFRTEAKHTIPHKPNATITPEFFAALLSGDVPQSLSVRWSLLYNMFDWELGRSYWVSKDLSLRPFLGIKGGWIRQSIHGQYHNLTINDILTSNSASERLKNNFWGFGPQAGINSKWRVSDFGAHFFNFFGDFSFATMWGSWTCNDFYKNTVPNTSSVNMKNATLGALMFRGFMGIGWDADFREGKSHFAAKLGFEMQLWLNQLRIATLQLQRLHHDLTLQGVTFNCRFDF